MIGTMVGDVLAETGRRVAKSGVATIDEVRAAGTALAGFSAAMADEERALKRFLYDRLYNAPALVAIREEAQRIVANLAAAYRADPGLLPPGGARRGEPPRARHRRLHRRHDRPLRNRPARETGRPGRTCPTASRSVRIGSSAA